MVTCVEAKEEIKKGGSKKDIYIFFIRQSERDQRRLWQAAERGKRHPHLSARGTITPGLITSSPSRIFVFLILVMYLMQSCEGR